MSRRKLVWGIGLPLVAVVVAAAVFAGVQLLSIPPAPVATGSLAASLHRVPAPASGGIQWPAQGAADLEVPGTVDFSPHGDLKPVPIASITKVMTTLVLLADHPLKAGQQGPKITVSAADVAQYQADVANKDSVVPVTAGEQLSEYQAIEAMLIPSADNVAEMVAKWDAGSKQAFVAKMNATAKAWGMDSTHFSDTSGLDPQTVSTTPDLMVLGQHAMSDPIVRTVVAMGEVTLPDVKAPLINYDYVLGKDGVVGIKTGSDSAAGGCFLFAAQVKVGGHSTLAYGAVLGQQSSKSIIDKALQVSLTMLGGLKRVLAGVTLVHHGEQVGRLTGPDGKSVTLSATKAFTVVAVPGTPVDVTFEPSRLRGGRQVAAGAVVGRLAVTAGKHRALIPVATDGVLRQPTLGWRLLDV